MHSRCATFTRLASLTSPALFVFGVFFGKTTFHELRQRFDGFLGVVAFGFQHQLRSLRCAQRQQIHDALASTRAIVSRTTSIFDSNLLRQLHKHLRRPRMQPLLVADHDDAY